MSKFVEKEMREKSLLMCDRVEKLKRSYSSVPLLSLFFSLRFKVLYVVFNIFKFADTGLS